MSCFEFTQYNKNNSLSCAASEAATVACVRVTHVPLMKHALNTFKACWMKSLTSSVRVFVSAKQYLTETLNGLSISEHCRKNEIYKEHDHFLQAINIFPVFRGGPCNRS